jgi:predicted TIM-barrel enzyme
VQEVEDLTKRGMADVVLVTGEGTSKGVDLAMLAAVKRASDKPVLVASGATLATLAALAVSADGVVVGSALRRGGVPGGAIDEELARTFAAAFRGAFPG